MNRTAPSEAGYPDPWFNLSAIPKLGQDMRIRGIRKDLLSLLLQLGREQHPNEFAGLLREQDGIIEEINLVPGTTSNEYSASLFLDMMPLDTHLAGSAHSHPNGVIFPSDADLGFFPRTGRCFSASGTPVDIGVVE